MSTMNELAPCPYRPAHSLIHHRLLKHIFKCEETYPPLQACPYNNSHILKTKADLKKHVQKCPSKTDEKDTKKYEKYTLQTCTANPDGSFTVVLCRHKNQNYCPYF